MLAMANAAGGIMPLRSVSLDQLPSSTLMGIGLQTIIVDVEKMAATWMEPARGARSSRSGKRYAQPANAGSCPSSGSLFTAPSE